MASERMPRAELIPPFGLPPRYTFCFHTPPPGLLEGLAEAATALSVYLAQRVFWKPQACGPPAPPYSGAEPHIRSFIALTSCLFLSSLHLTETLQRQMR